MGYQWLIWGVVRPASVSFVYLVTQAASVPVNTVLVLCQEVELRNSSSIHLPGTRNNELSWSVLQVMQLSPYPVGLGHPPNWEVRFEA